MGRRKRGLLEDLLEAPWWAGVVLGLGGYAALAYLLPALAADNRILAAMAGGAARLAPLWLGICLAGSALSLLGMAPGRNTHAAQRRQPNLNALSWQRFEGLVAEHFRRQGFAVQERGGPRPDGGVDLVLKRDGERFVVQCKHWKARQVGVGVVRELVGSITQRCAAGGYLVTSGQLTGPAQALAREAGVEVVDGTRLARELASASKRQKAPADVPPPAGENGTAQAYAPHCPRCRSTMQLRVARRGKHAGTHFWGCSAFPKCRGIRPAEKATA